MSELSERLRDRAQRIVGSNIFEEAAASIDELEAENAKLREGAKGALIITEGALVRAEKAERALAELTPLRDMLLLCGELGGMHPDESVAQYLRRLIDHIISTEHERLDEAREGK